MSSVAVILDDMFVDNDYTDPVTACKEHNHRVATVGPKGKNTVTGIQDGTEVKIDHTVDSVSVQKFGSLIIPGGASPGMLRNIRDAIWFVREFTKSGKRVFSICQAAILLAAADVLQGRTIAGDTFTVQEIKNAGAHFVDAQIVVDGNITSCHQADVLPSYIETMLHQLKQYSYNPQRPQQ